MKKFAALALVAVLATTAFGQIAATDFYNNGLVGPSQSMDLLSNAGSIVAPGVDSAEWSTGAALTASGTAASHSIWATGWTEDAGDFMKLSIQLAPNYTANITDLRYALRASATGPAVGFVNLYVNAGPAYSYTETNLNTNSYINYLQPSTSQRRLAPRSIWSSPPAPRAVPPARCASRRTMTAAPISTPVCSAPRPWFRSRPAWSCSPLARW